MPKIPGAENIQRKVASGIPGVVRLDGRDTMAGFGEISQTLKKAAAKQDAYESSKAEIDFLTLKTKQDRAFDQDDEYKTFDDRYTSELNKGLGEIALSISDPEARANFINKGKLRVEQGRTKIQGLSFSKEKDFERSTITADLDNLREVVLTGDPEEVAEARLMAGNRLDSAVELGYYTEQEKSNIKKTWKQGSAIGRLSMMEPENQIEALKKPWAKDLPSDVRLKLKKQAEKDFERNTAVDTVDSYLAQGMDQEQALKNIEGIKDKSLRREVEKRWDYDYQKNQDAKTENQRQYRDQFAYDVLREGLTIDSIKEENPEDWENMDSATKIYLEGLQADSVKPVSRSNPDAVLHISELAAKEDWRGVANLVKSYSDRRLLSGEDKIKYGKIAIDGSMPIELDSELTNVQAVNAALTSAQIDDEDAKDLILHNIGKWNIDYIKTHNKEPDDAARAQFIDDQLLNTPTDIGFIYDTEVPLYKINDEQWKDTLEEIREEEPEIAAKILEYFNPVSEKDISEQTPQDTQVDKVNPSRSEIMRVYHALKGE